jgi:hypothetical protein
MEEVENAVMEITTGKAKGLDDFPLDFYRGFWGSRGMNYWRWYFPTNPVGKIMYTSK